MYETAVALITRAGQKMGLDENAIQKLIKIDHEHIFKITTNDGQTFDAFRVQHNNKRGPYKGGIRFHPEVDRDEVRALATLMTFKTAAAGLPLGGGKGGVAVNPKNLSTAQLEEISRKYVDELLPYIGPDKDVPAPDVNTNAQIIDWMVDEYERKTGDKSKASFTGKSIANGGSLGRDAATGRGGVIALRQLLKHEGRGDSITYVVQGFGNVGSFFATVAAKDHANWRLVAASDSSATLLSPGSLDANALDEYKTKRQSFRDYKASAVEVKDANNILSAEVDVLVLAALGDVVNQSNMKNVKAKIILELANGPVSEEAFDYLTSQGVTIIPDIIANAGGVIVSYLEWQQNKQNEHWSETQVNKKLEEYMVKASDALYQTADKEKLSLKEAAFINAIKNLV